jgi:beta-carotene 15,15'-dioxygenase
MKYQSLLQLYLIPWLSLLGGFLLGKSAGENAEIYGAWLLISSALFFGLPHGAYDFWLLSDRANRLNSQTKTFIKLLFYYLITVVLIAVIWFLLPGFALIGFLSLTVWHFGSGDAVWENEGKLELIINSLGRGLLLMFAPLTFFPKESGLVLSKLVSVESIGIVDFLLRASPYLFICGIVLTAMNCLLFKARNTKLFSQKNLFTLLETTFLTLFFYLTTPLLALTIYLIGVHSWRHLLRLDVYESNAKPNLNRGLGYIISRFHVRALPITVVSIFGIALIFWFWQMRISDLADYTSAYLILLSALTVPHAILITRTELNYRRSSIFQGI